MSIDRCVLCGSINLIFTRSVRDNSKKKIFTCSDCGMIQLHPRITTNPNQEGASVDNQDANRKTAPIDLENNKKLYKGKLVDHPDILQLAHVLQNDYDRFLDHIKKYINPTKELFLLDVGTGYGHFPHLVKTDYKNITTYGLDCNYSKLKYGKDVCKLDFNFIFDKIENETFIREWEGKFDIVTSWHVLEHVYDPILWIKNTLRLLKEGGVAIFEFPNEDDELLDAAPEYSDLIHFEDHVNYFNKNTVTKLLEDLKITNFKVGGVQRYGFYNYIDWIRYGKKDKVNGDDYININDAPRSKYEDYWRKQREKFLTCDTLLLTIKK
tara:strand:- start:182 stop:1153 length:972 start_codon:yes stop_codon:yes gene_type:complete